MNLHALNYAQAEEMLAPLSDEQLLAAMAGSSRKIGDTAFSLLQRRRRTDLVIQGLRQHFFRTRDAKVRALNYVQCYGRSVVVRWSPSVGQWIEEIKLGLMQWVEMPWPTPRTGANQLAAGVGPTTEGLIRTH